MAKWVSTVIEEFRVGKVDEEITDDARKAGLSEVGIQAMKSGDKGTYKRELELIKDTVWGCTSGYSLWYNAATEVERRKDYRKIENELKCLPRYR